MNLIYYSQNIPLRTLIFANNEEKHAFFSAVYRSSSEIDHILEHEVNLNNYWNMRRIPYNLSDKMHKSSKQ